MVAGEDGKGRDDFNFETLVQAEQIFDSIEGRNGQSCQEQLYSQAVTKLVDRVRASFAAYRALMLQYQQNIELVDPQLKNNAPLVKTMSEFEEAWSLAQNQIGVPSRLKQLNEFSKLLWRTQQELPEFNEQVECRDAAIFMSIPALLIMEALLETAAQGSDIWRNLCTRFKEDITEGEDW